MANAVHFADAFLTDTLAHASNPSFKVRVEVVTEIGNDPDAQKVMCLTRGFAEGAKAVCLIGSDTPHLPTAFLQEAFGRLALPYVDAVFGASDNDGYYLIGSKQPGVVTSEQATTLGWQVSHLPHWYAVRTPDDLNRLHRDLKRGVVHAPATQEVLESS